MCGLCGEIRFDGPADVSAVQVMADSLRHRGPDVVGSLAQGGVALGHRRLSILDLAAASQQPMLDPDLGLAVVFNGGIYNFRALRALTPKGHSKLWQVALLEYWLQRHGL